MSLIAKCSLAAALECFSDPGRGTQTFHSYIPLTLPSVFFRNSLSFNRKITTEAWMKIAEAIPKSKIANLK